MTEDARLNVATIIGTARPGNYTAKALSLVNDELTKRGIPVTCIDPADMTLGFPGEPETADAVKLQQIVAAATGVVIATPEYHGSFASALKLMLENLGFPSRLARKPVALLGVAAGRIGAIKSLEQLRGVCSHVGALVLPGPVSVASVQQVFDETGRCTDAATEKAVRGVAAVLLDYIDDHLCPAVALEHLVRSGEVGRVS